MQEECIHKALEIDPNYVYIYLRAADMLEAKDMIQEMFERYRQAGRVDPHDSFVDLYQAIYYKSIHENFTAERYYRSTLEKCPRNIDGIKSYALFLRD